MKKNMQQIVEEARKTMTERTEQLSSNIEAGEDSLRQVNFQGALDKINEAMTSAYRKIAPNGKTAENASYIKELTEVHEQAKQLINHSRNAYKRINEFIRQRGVMSMAIAPAVSAISKYEGTATVVDAKGIEAVSGYLKTFDEYQEKIVAMEVSGTYWTSEKQRFFEEILENRAVTSALLNSMLESLSAEVDAKAEDGGLDSIDETINEDNRNFWTNNREIPPTIVAERLAQIRYNVDLVAALVKMKNALKNVPEAGSLIAKIDGYIIEAGEFLNKAREHYTELIAVSPQRKLQIEKAMKDYHRLSADLAAANESGNNQRIAIAELALRKQVQALSALSANIYDYEQELPDYSDAVTIRRFEGLDPEMVDISDARSEHRKWEEKREKMIAEMKAQEHQLETMAVGGTATVDGVKVSRLENGYMVGGRPELFTHPKDALMAGVESYSSYLETGGNRLASAETDEDDIEKDNKA